MSMRCVSMRYHAHAAHVLHAYVLYVHAYAIYVHVYALHVQAHVYSLSVHVYALCVVCACVSVCVFVIVANSFPLLDLSSCVAA